MATEAKDAFLLGETLLISAFVSFSLVFTEVLRSSFFMIFFLPIAIGFSLLSLLLLLPLLPFFDFLAESVLFDTSFYS